MSSNHCEAPQDALQIVMLLANLPEHVADGPFSTEVCCQLLNAACDLLTLLLLNPSTPGLIQTSVQWVPGLCPWGKAVGAWR